MIKLKKYFFDTKNIKYLLKYCELLKISCYFALGTN